MGYFYVYFLLFLKLINIIKGELNVEVYTAINGTEIPVYENIIQSAGTNLTLICKLVPTNMETTSHFDSALLWLKKQQISEVNNTANVPNFIKNTRKLYEHTTKGDGNQVIKSFNPLFMFDSGIYSCISLKYQLFKIVVLHVNANSQLHNLENLISEPNANSRYRRTLRKICMENKFSCDLGGTCLEYKYICDSIRDCKDGSDEDVKLCGYFPCKGKRQCSDGRCISEVFCCDKQKDPTCRVDNRSDCCYEQNQNGTDVANLAEVSEGGGKGKLTNFQIMWMVVICAVTLVFVTMCAVLIHSRSKETRNVPARNKTIRDRANSQFGKNKVKTTSFIRKQDNVSLNVEATC